jgi:hypothetical protein
MVELVDTKIKHGKIQVQESFSPHGSIHETSPGLSPRSLKKGLTIFMPSAADIIPL